MSETKRLLIIDDDPDFVEGIQAILEGANYQVDVKYNPKLARRTSGRHSLPP